MCKHGRMRNHLVILCCALLLSVIGVRVAGAADAAGCDFDDQGTGRVAAVVDARSFRLEDGREVKLAGIEMADRAKAAMALSALLVGHDVTLRGADDTPDRYGRQVAYAFLAGAGTPVQSELLRHRALLWLRQMSATGTAPACCWRPRPRRDRPDREPGPPPPS